LGAVQETDALVEKRLSVTIPAGTTPLFFYGRKTARGIVVLGGRKPFARKAALEKLEYLGGRNSADRVRQASSPPPVIADRSVHANAKFLALATHDLRNPIAGILAASLFLLDEASGLLDEEHARLLESIESSSRLLLRLIDGLLDVSKIEAGISALTSQPTDLRALIERNLVMNRLLANRRGIRIILAAEASVPPVLGDATRLSEVVDNLVANAIKFSPTGGTIEVGVRLEGNMIVMSVRDEGEGIAEDEVESMFKPFQKRRPGRATAEHGSGLGLAIAKGIVQGHGGRIEVESHPGSGSTFTVFLPISGKACRMPLLLRRVLAGARPDMW
jgi:signal transduction histidine kinase